MNAIGVLVPCTWQLVRFQRLSLMVCIILVLWWVGCTRLLTAKKLGEKKRHKNSVELCDTHACQGIIGSVMSVCSLPHEFLLLVVLLRAALPFLTIAVGF